MADAVDKKHTLATVCYSYKPVSDNEVTLVKGEIVKVFEKFENGWWVGETVTGQLGVFPGSYVKEVSNRAQSAVQSSTPCVDKSTRPVSVEEVKKVKKKSKKPEPISSATVLYDYEGQTPTELTLKKGDTISILRKLQADGWWQGEANGKIGHFPASYVREISTKVEKEEPKEITIEPTPKEEESKAKTFAVALYDYTGLSKEELSFKKGDHIIIVPLLDEESGWSLGECKNQKGTFPIKYVREIDVASLSKTTPSTWAISLYNFQGMDTSELNLNKGDIIEIVEQKADDAWWKGKVDNYIGHFPGNYIKMLPCQDEIQGIQIEDVVMVEETQIVNTNQPEASQPSIESEDNQSVHEATKEVSTPIKETETEQETARSVELKTEAEEQPEDVESVSNDARLVKEVDVQSEQAVEVAEAEEVVELEEGIATMKLSEDNASNDAETEIETSRDRSSSNESNRTGKGPSPRSKTKKRKKSIPMTAIGTCVATFDYDAPKKGILSFSSGDTIQIYSKAKEGAGWWKGQANGQIGYFPLSFVKEKKNKMKRKKSYVRALYDYNGESDTELSFKKGEIFACIEAEPVGSGWGRGEHRGRAGHFPPAYVAPVDGEGERGIGSTNTTASRSEIDDLRELVLSLQARMDEGASPTKRGRSESDVTKKFRESEKIRAEQAVVIATLSAKVDNLVTQVAKQNETISKQQKSLRKLNKGGTLRSSTSPTAATATPTGSREDYDKMQAYLNIEVRQRRDLESLIRNLEANHEVLSRQVNRMQRSFDTQSTKEKMGKGRLRSVGRDLTK